MKIANIILGGLAALVMGSCASEAGSPAYCSKDTDCKGDRICDKGVCVDSQESSSPNPCGNSPLYGKFLWEFSSCKGSLHMREDCVVGATDTKLGYAYNYQIDGQIVKYNKLDFVFSGQK